LAENPFTGKPTGYSQFYILKDSTDENVNGINHTPSNSNSGAGLWHRLRLCRNSPDFAGLWPQAPDNRTGSPDCGHGNFGLGHIAVIGSLELSLGTVSTKQEGLAFPSPSFSLVSLIHSSLRSALRKPFSHEYTRINTNKRQESESKIFLLSLFVLNLIRVHSRVFVAKKVLV
jgi:hypothetical protein